MPELLKRTPAVGRDTLAVVMVSVWPLELLSVPPLAMAEVAANAVMPAVAVLVVKVPPLLMVMTLLRLKLPMGLSLPP